MLSDNLASESQRGKKQEQAGLVQGPGPANEKSYLISLHSAVPRAILHVKEDDDVVEKVVWIGD